MNYNEAIQYLFDRLPMFQRIGSAAYKPDLTNTLRLCEALGNPQSAFHSVHIAGTNGKGSTSSMIATALTAAGYKTGLYTSPHLRSFTERIRINGIEIPQDDVVDFVLRTKPVIEEVNPSFFECTVAMAFDYFARRQVDVAVIEVGMGGRLDSTNVITPLLSVITNISWDHTDHLGNTLAAIAGEKAGIIKPGVPVVIGEWVEETEPVFRDKAALEKAPLFFAGDDCTVTRISQNLEGQLFNVDLHGQSTLVGIDLPGDYQQQNIATVWLALDKLRQHFPLLTVEKMIEGLSEVRKLSGLMGRMTVLRRDPLVICDVAHNEGGARWMLSQLLAIPHRQLRMVWGMVGDKDVSKVLALLPAQAQYYFVKPDIPRGMDATLLQQKAGAYSLHGDVYPSVRAGLDAALSDAAPDDLIFVGGSTFVVAEVV